MKKYLVENECKVLNPYSFRDALIKKRVNNGLIIQLEDNKNISEGFIFNTNIKYQLQKLLNTPKIIGTIIKVRFLYQPTNENKIMVYTQRKYYTYGEELELKISRENDTHIYATDKENFEYKFVKAPWERGPKYSKQIVDSKIKCRVYRVAWGKSFFERKEVPNPYYEEIGYWLGDKKLITKTFNVWTSNPDDEIKMKLKSDYVNRNANYIFSYLYLLEDFLINTIRRFDLKTSVQMIKGIIQIDKKILSSGFLLTQKYQLREKTKKNIDSKIVKFDDWLNYLKEIMTEGIESIFSNTIRAIKDKQNLDNEINSKFLLINFILHHIPCKNILDSQLEILINLLLENMILFKDEIPFPGLRGALRYRRKFVRRQLFSSINIESPIGLEQNSMLSHFIFLKKIEYEICNYFKEKYQALLEKSSLLYYQALYTTNKKAKVNLIENSLALLKNIKVGKKDFDDKESLYQWSISINIIIARNYELLFSLKTNEDDSIKYLIEARDSYVKAKDKRGFLIEYYIQYLSTITQLQRTDIEDLDKLIGNIILIHKRIINDLHYVSVYPVLNYLDQFYSSITLLGNNDQNKLDSLLELIRNPCKEPKGFPCIQKLAKIVLANNLIIDLLNKNYPFWREIQKFLKIGQFILPLDIITTEDNDSKQDNNLVFREENNLIEFKGSIELDINKYFNTRKVEISDKIRKSFLKTVVGMLNSSGGEIYIGVLELSKYPNTKKIKYFSSMNPLVYKNRIIIGIEKEIEPYNNSSDDHIRHISTLLRNRIDSNIMQNITINIESIKGKDIYKIIVRSYDAEFGYYLDRTEFYVRENNETLLYDNTKTITYLIKRKLKKINL